MQQLSSALLLDISSTESVLLLPEEVASSCADKISWIKVIEDIMLATFYFRHMEGSRYAHILGSL